MEKDPFNGTLPSGSRILVAPLDWGLGHAARCIPLIRRFIQDGQLVTIASDGRPAALLRLYFPELEFIPLKGYGITYGRRLPVLATLALQLPKLFNAVRDEHRWLEQLLRARHFEAVVSDNRYGLWSKRTRTVVITHQLFLQVPAGLSLLRGFIDRQIRRMIGRFDECWVPDHEGSKNLSGDLSHGKETPVNIRYIGWLSRFSGVESGKSAGEQYDCLMLISGPEPQRSILEKSLRLEALASGKKTLLVQGLPDLPFRESSGTLEVVSHLNDLELINVLLHSRKIVCRSGYSTLMDLMTIGRTAELIPTRGQTEQEYLARRMKEVFGWKIRNA